MREQFKCVAAQYHRQCFPITAPSYGLEFCFITLRKQRQRGFVVAGEFGDDLGSFLSL